MAAKRKAKAAPAETPASSAAVDEMIAEDAARPVAASPDTLASITAHALLMKEKAQRVQKLEEEVDRVKAEVRELRETVLPALMQEAQVTSIGLEDGEGTWIERSDAVFASISKANAAAACAWLDEHGYGAIVKSGITIPIARGDRKMRERIVRSLRKAGVEFEETSGVHPQTLLAFVRESVEAGRELPKSITYHIQPVVDLKKPKARRPKAAK